MAHAKHTPGRKGFTILEVMVALTLGLIITAGAVALLQGANQSAQMVARRSDMQGNTRGGMNEMMKDLNLAGTGLGSVNTIPVATTAPVLGCYQNGSVSGCNIGGSTGSAGYLINTIGTNSTSGGSNVLYVIDPMPSAGPIDWTSSSNHSDAITVVYNDFSINLSIYPLATGSAFFPSTGSFVTFNVPSGQPCIDDPAVGFQVGDVVLFTGPNGGHALAVVEGFRSVATGIQSLPGSASTNLVCNGGGVGGSANSLVFSSGDSFNFNQPNTGSTVTNSFSSLVTTNGGTAASASNFTASRLAVITYFLHNDGTGNLQLMRQYGGRSPIPVSDNVSQFDITYDIYDTSGSLTVESSSAYDNTVGAAEPAYIRKINVLMGVRSTRPMNGGKYDNLTLRTSVSPRDLDYVNLYTGSITGSSN